LSFLGRDKKFLWMAPGVYVLSHHFYGGSDPWGLVLGVPGGAKLLVRVRSGTAAEVVTATCDFIVRLLATSEEHDVYIRGCSDGVSNPLSGAGLSLFFSREPKLPSPCHIELHGPGRRAVSCTCEHVTT
jgi:hypothetical protein